jgi:hypothetical protein
MPRPISKLALANCLDKQFNHPFRLFYVYQFLHLVYPFATAYFRKLLSLLRIQSAPALAFEGLLPLTGAPLDDLTSMPVARSGSALQTTLPT